jgi:hypothetical protein
MKLYYRDHCIITEKTEIKRQLYRDAYGKGGMVGEQEKFGGKFGDFDEQNIGRKWGPL